MLRSLATSLVGLLCLSCAAAAQAESLPLPAIGVWNGYLEHMNVVECSNLSDTTISIKLTVLSNRGEKLGAIPLELKGRATSHTILNTLAIANSYGIYRVESRNGNNNLLVNCHTAVYRPTRTSMTKDLEYAFILPNLQHLVGESTGLYNSFNPSGNSSAVLNYLSIYNTGQAKFSARVYLYDQNGTPQAARNFRVRGLNPNERRDYPLGHPQGQQSGSYVIVPDSSSFKYGAFLMRYGPSESGGFQFALPLLAQTGTCDPGPVPASTMNPANNWIEIANPTSTVVEFSNQVNDRFGAVLFAETRALAPHSQQHLLINNHLGENAVGSFRARCTHPENGGRLLIQSLYYGHADQSDQIQWAYATQARGALFGQEPAALAVNTYLGAANWVKLLNAENLKTSFNYEIANVLGSTVGRGKSSLPKVGAVDVGVHSLVGQNFVGLGLFFPQSSASFFPELLRVFPDSSGDIGYIMNVPAARTSLAETPLDTDVPPGPEIIASSMVVFGYNDLGMHCMNQDFSEMMILPPANFLHATVIDRRGEEPRIVKSGISVKFDIPGNTESVSKTNFWTYAKQLLGINLAPNSGLTGNSLSGSLLPSANDWEASAIPITQITDSRADNPYQLATISVLSGNTLMARTRAVVPVSWEISCNLCHNQPGVSPATDILRAHDRLHGTTLENEKPVACGRCHSQPPLNLPGEAGIKSLSRAMHGAHASRMHTVSSQLPAGECYACHPGKDTKCLRDVHFSKGIGCKDCHGEMSDVAAKANPWQDEPSCGSCHKQRRPDFDFEEPGKLFRNSRGHHGVPCAACHGSPHAITPSVVTADNIQSTALQGHPGTINTCVVCHNNTPDDSFSHRLSGDD